MTTKELEQRIRNTYRVKGQLEVGATDEELMDWLSLDDLEDEELQHAWTFIKANYQDVGGKYKDNRSIAKQKERAAALAAQEQPGGNDPVSGNPIIPTYGN